MHSTVNQYYSNSTNKQRMSVYVSFASLVEFIFRLEKRLELF